MLSLFKRKPQEEPRYTEAALRWIEETKKNPRRGNHIPFCTLKNGMMGTYWEYTEEIHRPFSFKAEWRGKMRTFYVPTVKDGNEVFIDEASGKEYRRFADGKAWDEIFDLFFYVDIKNYAYDAEVI